jgi:phage FluMu protein Com
MNYITKKCPHCKNLVFLLKKEFNCKIYRHGVYKKDLKQIDSHMKKEDCIKLAKNGLIYGCGKPFKIKEEKKDVFEIVKCDYI